MQHVADGLFLVEEILDGGSGVRLHTDTGAPPAASAALRVDGNRATIRELSSPSPLLHDLLYFVGRRARIGGATVVVSPSAMVGGSWPTPSAHAHRLDRWMHESYAQMTSRGSLDRKVFADEVAETVRAWLAEGNATWKFFRAVRERRLSRPAYVYTLSNLHQFVRHTTRLIGRAIGHSADPTLRKHWVSHLVGEVNHELIIERDLAHLGEDVGFVMKHMAPNLGARQFMAAQESAIAYYADPVLMMASPLAAEAVTAFLEPRFIQDLLVCIEGWGVREPKQAARFLTSHMSTDGGEDGHWKLSIDILPSLLSDDDQLAHFLVTNAACRAGLTQLWNSCIDELATE